MGSVTVTLVTTDATREGQGKEHNIGLIIMRAKFCVDWSRWRNPLYDCLKLLYSV